MCPPPGPDMHPTLAFGEEMFLYPIKVAAPLEEHSPHLSHIVGLYGLQQDLQSPQWPWSPLKPEVINC